MLWYNFTLGTIIWHYQQFGITITLEQRKKPNNLYQLIFANITDEGQRKRKVEVEEEKPAKRKSVECEDVPVHAEAADVTASALENLTIVLDTEEEQKAVPDTTNELPSSSSISNCSPEQASNNGIQPSTGKVYCYLEGPLYPFAKLNHVKIFGLFTRHE